MTLYLGIDIGGTKIAVGLVTPEGRVLHSARVPTPLTGGFAILDAALGLARETLAGQSVTAIGIGTGGQVDAARGVVVSATDLLPGWAGTDVAGAFQSAFGLPCAVDNDVNALAVGEARLGAGRGLGSVVFLALGTGVGGAWVRDGQVHHGATWTGGEFGHLYLTASADAPRQTLEDWASGPGLARTYLERTGQAATGEAIAAEAAADPNCPAAWAIERTGEALGFGLSSLANALDPELIVVGGGLASLGDVLFGPARAVLARCGLPGPARCPVVAAALGAEASLVGAACLTMPRGKGGRGDPAPTVLS